MTRQLEAALGPALTAIGVKAQAVYLHGSWGTDFERADSDIDLAVLAQSSIDAGQRFQLAHVLREKLHISCDIDVADLRHCDTVFAAHVVTEGRRLVMLDRAATEAFEALALAKYARLNEERADILNDIRQRGTVYGHGALA